MYMLLGLSKNLILGYCSRIKQQKFIEQYFCLQFSNEMLQKEFIFEKNCYWR